MQANKVYHFIGIKGSGMSALAGILHDEGYTVQGSDVETYFFTQQGLEERHIPIHVFSADNIAPDMEIILGNAYGDDHEEVVRAKELGLNIRRYHKFVGEFIKNYTSIGIAGAHGKTSTTGLMSHVLRGLEKTSFLIGDGTGKGVEDAEYFVLEADEYRSHFLAYSPDYAIITNIDFDHPDYFKDLDHVMSIFEQYADQTQKVLLACGDDENVRRLETTANVVYYGLDEGNDFHAVNVLKHEKGSRFDVVYKGEPIGHFEIPTFGDHNIQNALAVIAVCYFEGLDRVDVRNRLATYPGVKRRFNEKEIAGHQIIDDYAHHPREIRATISAARQRYPEKEVVAIFQPHTFSRTEALLEEFGQALSEADAIYLCDIFASARESAGTITIEDLADVTTPQATVLSEDDLSPLLNHENAVTLFMGAGDVGKYQTAYEALLTKSYS